MVLSHIGKQHLEQKIRRPKMGLKKNIEFLLLHRMDLKNSIFFFKLDLKVFNFFIFKIENQFFKMELSSILM